MVISWNSRKKFVKIKFRNVSNLNTLCFILIMVAKYLTWTYKCWPGELLCYRFWPDTDFWSLVGHYSKFLPQWNEERTERERDSVKTRHNLWVTYVWVLAYINHRKVGALSAFAYTISHSKIITPFSRAAATWKKQHWVFNPGDRWK